MKAYSVTIALIANIVNCMKLKISNMKNTILLIGLAFTMFTQAQQNIFINQIGYLSSAPKTVLLDYKADSFEIYNVNTGQHVFTNPFLLKKESDTNSGMTTYAGDFSDLKSSGKYLIKVYSSLNSGINSYPFYISDTVFSNMINLANKSLYLQRCGLEMEEKHVGKFAREKCHLQHAEYHPTCELKGKKEVTGGWHDAGDYGKYIAPGSVTIGLLLTAYQMHPEKFSNDTWNIPESKNGTPDLLDEIKYELNWMFKMQREDGAVHEKVHTKDYVQFVMPSEGKAQQYIYEVSSTATADFAAIMALSSRIYKTFDKELSEKCLNASLKAYKHLEKNPDIFPEGGFKNPADTKAGGYSDAFDKDERLWAAAELYLATGDKKYLNNFSKLNEHFKSEFTQVGWQNPSTLAYYSLLLSDANNKLASIQVELKAQLELYCKKQLETANSDGFGIAMKASDYVWGSNGTVLNKAINLQIAHHITKNQDYLDLSINHLNYILGLNPNKICYVTGVGSKRILHLHHAPTVADLNFEPIPGILSGGPNKYRDDAALMNVFTENTPPARIFLDNEESYASNENTIYTNASLIFVATYLNNIK